MGPYLTRGFDTRFFDDEQNVILGRYCAFEICWCSGTQRSNLQGSISGRTSFAATALNLSMGSPPGKGLTVFFSLDARPV